VEAMPYFRSMVIFGRELVRGRHAAHLCEEGRGVDFGLRQQTLLALLFTVAVLICQVSWPNQAEGQKRTVIVDTKPTNPSSVQLTGNGNYFALIVGINDYQYLPHLITPHNDAQDLALLLGDQYGFKTQLLLDPTRDQIVEALDRYRRTLSERDNLLIYYAGHGYFDKEINQGYWAPVDAGQDTYARWIIATEITGTANAVPARHVLVISDSCYSGMLTRDVKLPGVMDRPNYIERMLQAKSRQVMASGGDEPVADSDAPGRFSRHSVFANVLLQNLSQFKTNEFTAEQLFAQVKEQVHARAKQEPQYKTMGASSDQGGDFVFIRVGSGAARVQAYEKEPPPIPLNPDEEAVRAALDNYEEAYASMDVRELKKVWPSLSKDQEKELKNGFAVPNLRAVKVQLRNRMTLIDGSAATAKCDQWMIYTFAGRRQPPQINSVVILLSKNTHGEWAVSGVKGN
jgi:uncharacterized caspase-like protein